MIKPEKAEAFVLLHGAWHDGWSWGLVSRELRDLGYACETPDMPTDDARGTFNDCAEAVVGVMDDMQSHISDIVLVAHSRAANIALWAAGKAAVKQVIFVCGSFEPETLGLSREAAEKKYPRKHQLGADMPVVSIGDELAVLHPESLIRRIYYNACPEPAASSAIVRLRPQRMPTNAEYLRTLPDVPSQHLYCRDDQLLNPAYSATVAADSFGVAAQELPGGHFSPLFAYPKLTAQKLIALSANQP